MAISCVTATKPALVLHLTTPHDHRKCGTYMYPLITDSTVNESTSDSMARVTPGAYNSDVNYAKNYGNFSPENYITQVAQFLRQH